MDRYKAEHLETLLKSKLFGGLTIEKLINHGKSAAVFLAKNYDGLQIALKIFDNEMIDRFGHEVQQLRIQQEIDLKGHDIPNLIQIIDGGQEEIDGVSYFFISMEFIEGSNLKEYIENKLFTPEFVKQVAYTIYKVSEALLEKGVAHRDIKPENIMIDNDNNVILMDLGVLKLIGTPSFSDSEDKQFVGTLRYAPPEFLTRQEKDSIKGWQAINRYQIGAVMHDLIMKTELFHGIAPYSNLVLAIKEDAPIISSDLFPFETIQLARDLLTKDPQTRLNLTPANRIIAWTEKSDENSDDIDKEIEVLLKMTSGHKVKLQEIESITRSIKEKREIRVNLAEKLANQLTDCFIRLKDLGGCPHWLVYPNFYFSSDALIRNDCEVRNLLFEINGDIVSGFAQPFYLLLKFQINEQSEARIGILGFLMTQTFHKKTPTIPIDFFRQLNKEKNPPANALNQFQLGNPPVYFNSPLYEIFNGVFGFDRQFDDKLILTILKFTKLAIGLMEPEIKFQLSLQEKRARGESTSFSKSVDPKSKLIYKLD